ncbi:hypothetical protein ABE61_21005 [Lysinibacillus sphaericus]|nr:hypothetical protein [Lysinibacillus sphaericus]MBG9476502.1 hypothetical protein [Lysinibacillus sphaericus]MBG9594634.1 hypothetical protein [Lysinibacillus sphaericus]
MGDFLRISDLTLERKRSGSWTPPGSSALCESEASAAKRQIERKSTHVMVMAIKNLMLNDIKFYIIFIGIFLQRCDCIENIIG